MRIFYDENHQQWKLHLTWDKAEQIAQSTIGMLSVLSIAMIGKDSIKGNWKITPLPVPGVAGRHSSFRATAVQKEGRVLDLLHEVLISEVSHIYCQSYVYFVHSFRF